MSCSHGNHPDTCYVCDEVADAYRSGVENERQREWVGLTEESREECKEWLGHDISSQVFYVIEQKLKEKNT
jgi:hypothetical protein